MSFMYLHLRYVESGTVFGSGVRASVETTGDLKSLGTSTSRWSDQPFAVFAIEGFDGLDNISTDDLLARLLERMGAAELQQRLKWKFTTDELIELLRSKIR